MKQATAMALFLLAVFIAVILLVAALIVFLCSRPPRMPNFTPRVWYTSDSNPKMRRSFSNSRLSLPLSYASSIYNLRRDSSFIRGGIGGTFSIYDNPSESFNNDMISISPSQPVMIGSESQKGGIVKLMITPPTPSKANFELDTEYKLDVIEFQHCEDAMDDDDESTECFTFENTFKCTEV